MCGIAGKLNFNDSNVAEREISTMISQLKHRGPDDSGIFTDGQVGLGHRRLSIIDLSRRGRQPMAESSGSLHITFNGEIYNFPELRKKLQADGVKFRSNTDTEVILYLYKKYGPDCVKRLRGMFAFAIWDKSKKELFVARDRVGKKPLKYYLHNDFFAFSSELKALFALPGVPKEIDWPAIDEFLTYKYIHAPRTGFKNIKKLPPACYMIVRADRTYEIKKYWDLDFSQKKDYPESIWQEKIRHNLIEATKLRLISDVPLGVHLSGGIDSSLIVAIMARELNQKVSTFSIGFKEEKYNELEYARKVAKQYHTDHHELVIAPNALEILPKLVEHYEEPYADASAIPSWYLAAATKEYFSVALNGDGGDENFAGYERYHAEQAYKYLKCLPLKTLAKNLASIGCKITGWRNLEKFARLLASYDPSFFEYFQNIIAYVGQAEKAALYSPELKNNLSGSDPYQRAREFFNKSKNLEPLDRLLYTGFHTHLPDDLLVKADISSMAHSLELRSPMLDHKFMELSAGMPSRLKLKGRSKKYMLKKIAQEYIPNECIKRPKHGFIVPLNYWFKNDLKNFLVDSLNDDKFISYGFEKQAINKLLAAHFQGKANNENQLYALLMLRHWLKQWFE